MTCGLMYYYQVYPAWINIFVVGENYIMVIEKYSVQS